MYPCGGIFFSRGPLIIKVSEQDQISDDVCILDMSSCKFVDLICKI